MSVPATPPSATDLPPQVACLHPGEMGTALGALIRRNGFRVGWTGAGRSARTRERAIGAGLQEADSLAGLCAASALVLSICPPHAALDQARAVASLGYRGLYVDANAISPAHARQIGHMLGEGGAGFVDAAIVGPPPTDRTDTVLYLSGEAAGHVARYFSGAGLRVEILGPEIGMASALKMCHSAMHKGQLALLWATLACAQTSGVRPALESLFASRPGTAVYLNGLEDNLRRAAKAWRFAGEMDEVAQTLGEAGLPVGFHEAASEVFQRLAGLRADAAGVSMQRLLDLLQQPEGRP